MSKQRDGKKMILKNYWFDNIAFELTNRDATAVGEYDLGSIFSKRIKKIDDGEFEFSLMCEFSDTEEKKLPYRFTAEIVGRFLLQGWESEENTYERELVSAGVLYPILRAFALTLTANVNIDPPLIMGLVNTEEWEGIKSAE